MSYNILKTMTDSKTGKKTCVLLLDGLESILEVKELDQALNMAAIFNQNTDSGWLYEVRKGGIIYKFNTLKQLKTIKNN
jgi:hypothetical protein